MVESAINSLMTVINKSRVHFYKPIQVAEILHRARVHPHSLEFSDFDSIRKQSKSWRDRVSQRLVGNKSTSSAKYQDDIFNAISPHEIETLSKFNIENNGKVEEIIYSEMKKKWDVLLGILNYCQTATPDTFSLIDLEKMFTADSGLKRSIDKMFEITSYTVISFYIQNISKAKISINIESNAKIPKKIREMLIPSEYRHAEIFRVGVANAADRGLDMVTNFGPIVQVKHLPLTLSLVQEVCNGLPMNEVYLVVNQDNFQVRQQLVTNSPNNLRGVITTDELSQWYSEILSDKKISQTIKIDLLEKLSNGMIMEFPHLGEFEPFLRERGYQI